MLARKLLVTCSRSMSISSSLHGSQKRRLRLKGKVISNCFQEGTRSGFFTLVTIGGGIPLHLVPSLKETKIAEWPALVETVNSTFTDNFATDEYSNLLEDEHVLA